MRTNVSGFLRKQKKRRVLVLSAGSIESGVQCLYVAMTNDSWEILSSTCHPYPQKIATLLSGFAHNTPIQLTTNEIGLLDFRLSCFFTESAKITLSTLPAALRKPHLAIIKKPCIWKGTTNSDQQGKTWDLTVGDAQHLSSSLGVPVLTDFIRHNCIAGGPGKLPLDRGNKLIAAGTGGVVLFVNIGLVSHLTIVDTLALSVTVETDTGPGTSCINTIIRRHQLSENETFDRDGSLASQGMVNSDCLDAMSKDQWFLSPPPKYTVGNQFDNLLQLPIFTALSPIDQLATITALTARTIYEICREQRIGKEIQQTVLVSGGGSRNRTLMNYLKTYFDTIPVKSVEEIGIPADMRIPLAFGLTVNAFTNGTTVSWESGNNPKVSPLGKWVFP